MGEEKISKRVIAIGDSFQIGPYLVMVQDSVDHEEETLSVFSPKNHEFIVACDESILIERAILKVVYGPDKGQNIPLLQMENMVGGLGSKVCIADDSLMPEHFSVVVTRGRAMVVPKNGPVFLDGHRIMGITPIYPDDVLSVGQSRFTIEPITKEEVQPRHDRFGGMIGETEIMQKTFGRLKLFASHDFPVLITGESGTGKELAAKGLHDQSIRSTGPFVAINCASIPESLVESELFGHEKGAFSGAHAKKDGAFHQAHRGTLFLDELGELSLEVQKKLLRVLESGEIRRVGAPRPEFPDVRIVAATNRDLSRMVVDGTFREDLLFRLQVLAVALPPLRERKGDILRLAEHICSSLGQNCTMSERARNMLWDHKWPGNVRELRNVLSRGFVLSGGTIDAEHIEVFSQSLSEHEVKNLSENRSFLERTLLRFDGNKAKVARELGIPRSTLVYKMRKYGLH
jgi:transcriptional regulator with PAS, ATPase and Fis domain